MSIFGLDTTKFAPNARTVRQSIGDFMRGDGDGSVDWRWGLLGGTAVYTADMGISKAYLKAIAPLVKFRESNAGALNQLLNIAKQQGVRVRKVLPEGFNGSYAPGRLSAVKETANEMLPEVLRKHVNANIVSGRVNIPASGGHPGVLAHELGHHAQNRKFIRAALFGGALAPAFAGAAMATGDKQDALAYTGAGTLGGLTTLANELHASHKGGQLLKGVGKGRLGAFMGIPTYAMLAALPGLSYGVKNYFGGFDTPQRFKTASLKEYWDNWDPIGLKAQRKAQRNRDLGTAAIFGGAGVMADTSRAGFKAMEIGDKMVAHHARVLSNAAEELGTTTKALENLRTYGRDAGALAKLRILGIPGGRILQALPPGAGNSGNFLDVFKAWFGGRGLPAARLDDIKNYAGHYAGFMADPQTTLAKEMLTTHPFTSPKVRPAVVRAGLRPDEVQPLLTGHMDDPLGEFERMVKLRKPGINHEANALASRLARHLHAMGHTPRAVRNGAVDAATAMKFGPAGYGRLARGLGKYMAPVGALGALGMGAWGYNRFANDHPGARIKLASMPWNGEPYERPGLGEYGVNTALLAGGTKLMHRGYQYRPSNLIAVTAGRLAPPLIELDVGAGHITPAKGIHEALMSHPAVRSGEFVTDIALRELQPNANELAKQFKRQGLMFNRKRNLALQKPLGLSRVKEHGQRHALMTIDSGFGATQGIHSFGSMIAHKPSFSINPAGVTLFFPDSRDGYGVPNAFMFGNDPSLIHKKQRMITFGEGNPPGSTRIQNIGHYPVHPAIQDSVLDMAEHRMKNPVPNRAVWLDAANKLQDKGYTQAAQQIREALHTNKILVPFTGSARGDYVAQRIHEGMSELLKTDPATYKRVKPIAFLGAEYGVKPMMDLVSKHNGIALPNTNKFFTNGSQGLFDMTGAGDFHMGSTGASAHAEARMAKSPSGYITDYGPVKQREQALFKGLMSEEWLRNRGFVDLDSWNSGTLKDVRRNKGGILDVTTPKDFVKAMQDVAAGRMKEHPERAAEYLRMARESKAQMADAIIRHARDLRGKTLGMMGRRMGAGGLLAALGGLGLVDGISRATSSTPGLFKNRIDHMFR